MLGKPLGWGFQEGAAGHGEGTHLGSPVALGKQGGRSPGRVIARLRFTFEHDDATAGCKMPGDGCAGNAATDDEEVGLLRRRKDGHAVFLWASRKGICRLFGRSGERHDHDEKGIPGTALRGSLNNSAAVSPGER
jgi:hypothetical protein